ncbi:MAG TPA: autotransporter-associated beta strand repeat-containing protein [Verrucomicrobiae bacterium]|jgi:autotransporter-associated beta strand protein|nr:autotransporter-associated beta strand repeat-containing protein [Verrucomicrobiae bacterium]
MKPLTPVLPHRLGLLLASTLCLLIARSAKAGNDYWAGVPGVTATTNWTDAANWTSAVQTYFNEVEFTGVGANANNDLTVNNVLDATTGVAQVPIWELDYVATNGNYTTLINPGVTLVVGVGNHGYLTVGADQLNGSTPAPANAVETITLTGSGGTLSMPGTGANLWVGQGSPTPGDSHNITLDLSGLDTFNASTGAGSGNFIHVAYGNQSQNSFTPNENGTLYLARTNVISLGNDFQICNTPGTNSMTCGVYLGINNYILTGTGNLVVGGPGTGPAGAVMAFNPGFVGGPNVPVAYLGGNGADGRIVNFYIGNANGNSQVAGTSLCDFTGGNVTVMAGTMQLGQGGNAGANSQGTLSFNNGNVNVNNATIGNQGISSGGMGVGIVNIGSSATLTVNSTLTLAAVTGTLTPGSAGTLNANGGAVVANNIVGGGGASTISLKNGSLTLSGTGGTIAAPINALTTTNSTLNLGLASPSSSNNIVVTSLTTGGTTNIINITATPAFSSYPVQIPLVKYSGSIGGAGYNFGLGTLPALYAGHLMNNSANSTIDLVLTAGSGALIWTGSINGNWDTITANWTSGGAIDYADGDFVGFLDGANNNTVNITTAVLPAGITVSNTSPAYTFDGSGYIGGSVSLVKRGSGTLVMDNTGNNTFSGGVTISGGTLQVGNNDSAGNLPSGSITDNANLAYARLDSLTVNNTISGTGSIVQMGGSTLTLSGANTFTGNVVVTNGSTLVVGSSSALGGGSGSIVVADGSTLDINGNYGSKPVVVSGSGVGGNGAITDSGGAVYGYTPSVILSGDTTFAMPNRWDLSDATLGTGGHAYNLTLNGSGYFQWNNVSADSALANINLLAGQWGLVGSTTLGNPNGILTLTAGAQLVFYGANVNVNKQVDFQSGATISVGGGNNVLNGGMTLEPGFCQFSIGGGTSLTLSNVLSGSGAFYQSGGNGTATLWGNSPSFTGGILLYNGQMNLNGLIGSGITSLSGTFLTGSGTANGLVDVSGSFYPGDINTAGTFTAGAGLTLEGPAGLTMDLAPTTTVGGGVNDLIAVTGDLTAGGNNIVINPLTGTLASGSYVLMTYSGNLNGTFGTVSTAATSRYSFALDTSTPHQVKLVVTGAANVLAWNNNGNNGQWDVQSSFNWTNLTTHVEDQFYSADVVLLDDRILTAANPATNLMIGSGQVVAPSVITNNSSANYSISGAGKISGTASIVKLGSSTLTISNVNDFTGNFTVAAGTVKLDGLTSAAGAPNGTLTISNGATLAVNLSGNYPAGDAGFGNKPIVVSGTGANGQGAIQFTGGPLYDDGATLGLGQNIKLIGNTTFSGAGRFDWGYPGAGTALSSGGSNYNLTVSIGGYSEWKDIGIDTNLGNIDLYTSAGSQQTLNTRALGVSLGNPTNILTLHSNVVLNIVHGDTTVGDNGYAKVVHILPTAAWQYQPSGGPGDYRLKTSFVLETNAGLYFYSVDGGSGSGVAIAGTVTLNDVANFQIGNAPVTFSNVISGTGGFYLNQYGGSPLVFAAANTYQGVTDIRSGMVLALIGNGSISGSANISLAASATLDVSGRIDQTLTLVGSQTLQGNGAVNGNLTVGGNATVSPGGANTIGTLAVTNAIHLLSVTAMDVNKNAGTSDQLNCAGTITYGGTLNVSNLAGTLAAGDSFKLFNAGTYNGTFATIAPAPGAGLAWDGSGLTNGTIKVIAVSAGPTIGKITVSGGKIIISGSNNTGSAGTYHILIATNVFQPLSSWTVLTNGTFDGSGNFSSTNAVGTNAHQFYILQVP